MELQVVVKMLVIVLVIMGAFLPLITWVERKQSAVMQDRIGANRADLLGITALGLLHPAADVLKLLTKEDVVPAGANRWIHQLAPVIALVPAIITLAVVPYGGAYQFDGWVLNLVVADIDWGMLYVFAVGSLATYGAVMAGWASNSNWGLLGSMRASAQMISYEVTMGLSLVGLFMVYESLRLTEIAQAQDATFRIFGFLELLGTSVPWWLGWLQLPSWGVFLQPLGFILFLTCIMAENKRPPFDAPEGESELVAGYHMEYSGMRFGLFYTAEFLEVPVIGMIVTTLFLGGWSIPWLSQGEIIGGLTPTLGVTFATVVCMALHFVSFLLKVVVMIWLQMALRWTLPRFRYDQVMDLCWKMILPISIANAFVTGGVILLLERA
ncbi:MAG TPA: complex I subunit 1 family protein [Myxococcota bacterium]|nr:complex I subunit 1 family protein [Myxococcota bacterium]